MNLKMFQISSMEKIRSLSDIPEKQRFPARAQRQAKSGDKGAYRQKLIICNKTASSTGSRFNIMLSYKSLLLYRL